MRIGKMIVTLMMILCATPFLVAGTGVFINREELSSQELNHLNQRQGTPVQAGHYWYDKTSGAWGYQGGPMAGFISPGMAVGGSLRADASSGQDGVYVNGRSLHRSEVISLQALLGVVYQGRYWMDARGNYGVVNGVYLGNLFAIANQAAQNNRAAHNGGGSNQGGAQNSFWRSNTTDNTVSSSSDGGFYIMGDGFSYSSF